MQEIFIHKNYFTTNTTNSLTCVLPAAGTLSCCDNSHLLVSISVNRLNTNKQQCTVRIITKLVKLVTIIEFHLSNLWQGSSQCNHTHPVDTIRINIARYHLPQVTESCPPEYGARCNQAAEGVLPHLLLRKGTDATTIAILACWTI